LEEEAEKTENTKSSFYKEYGELDENAAKSKALIDEFRATQPNKDEKNPDYHLAKKNVLNGKEIDPTTTKFNKESTGKTDEVEQAHPPSYTNRLNSFISNSFPTQ